MTTDLRPLPLLACRLNSMASLRAGAGLASGRPSTVEMMSRLHGAEGITAVELNYPQHLEDEDREKIAIAAEELKLPITSINLRFPDDPFLTGVLSHPRPAVRELAVALIGRAADEARALGADAVTLWLDKDGWDYPFQVDHAKVWDDLITSLRQIVTASPDIRFSIEYKPCDPRARSLVPNFGMTMLAVDEVGADNLGVRLDFAHMLMARESPAQGAGLATHRGKLFGIDFNDGYGQLDDGLMIGSMNVVETLEFLWYLQRSTFDGVVYFDTFPIREDPIAEANENVRRFRTMWNAASALDGDGALSQAMADHDAIASQRLVFDAIWSVGTR